MNAMVDLVIRGAQLVSGSAIIDAAVAVDGERIVAVGEERLMPPARETLDASGLFGYCLTKLWNATMAPW